MLFYYWYLDIYTSSWYWVYIDTVCRRSREKLSESRCWARRSCIGLNSNRIVYSEITSSPIQISEQEVLYTPTLCTCRIKQHTSYSLQFGGWFSETSSAKTPRFGDCTTVRPWCHTRHIHILGQDRSYYIRLSTRSINAWWSITDALILQLSYMACIGRHAN